MEQAPDARRDQSCQEIAVGSSEFPTVVVEQCEIVMGRATVAGARAAAEPAGARRDQPFISET